jgi:hypothetical protein
MRLRDLFNSATKIDSFSTVVASFLSTYAGFYEGEAGVARVWWPISTPAYVICFFQSRIFLLCRLHSTLVTYYYLCLTFYNYL